MTFWMNSHVTAHCQGTPHPKYKTFQKRRPRLLASSAFLVALHQSPQRRSGAAVSFRQVEERMDIVVPIPGKVRNVCSNLYG